MDDYGFGIHAVNGLIESDAERIVEVWIQKGIHNTRITTLIKTLDSRQIPLRFVDKQRMDRKSGEAAHQGVLAILRAVKVLHENDLFHLLDALKVPPFLLLLDGITDPHNLGACLRSADAAGVHAIIAPKDKSSPLNAVARKVACGAAETVPYFSVTNLSRTMKTLKERGIWLIGAAGESRDNLYSIPLEGAIGLVMGAEDKGLRRLTREQCDSLIRIPMAGTISSLNVSVATAVCLFEAVRQRAHK